MAAKSSYLSSLGKDIPASIVVALVALPLCLGIALASGAPLFSGLIAGIVGGIVVGTLSKSQLSVSGPAAGLTVIVLDALDVLPSWEVFLLAVALAGLMQIALYFTRSGILSEFVPGSVITGMLAAIGLILILKQIPHAVGYDGDFEGSLSFLQPDGLNTLSALFSSAWEFFLPGPLLIAAVSLAFLFWWDANRPKDGLLKLLPGPLVVVLFAVAANAGFKAFGGLVWRSRRATLSRCRLQDPWASSSDNSGTPDFLRHRQPRRLGGGGDLGDRGQPGIAAVHQGGRRDRSAAARTSNKNHELLAQGGGNFLSGLIGGLPLTSVIVRSSANVAAGGETKSSAIMHGFWLLLSILLIPVALNLIPLAALAAILIQTGYKLTTPKLYASRWARGWHQFAPFLATIAAILLTDLLRGIIIGLAVGFIFVVARNFRTAVSVAHEDSFWLIRARRNLYFIHKYEFQKSLNQIPDGASVMIDLERAEFVDPDNIEILNSFARNARFRDIAITIRGDVDHLENIPLDAPSKKVAYA